MTQIVLIGLGAGAAAALLFASVASGVVLSVFLFYLAPLPILIAALGWSHWAGLLAAVVAAICLGLAFGMFFFAAFLSGIGAPAWWLGYLALLGRPAMNGGGSQLEWYPPGRLVLWAAILGAVVVTAGLAGFGGDEQAIHGSLKGALDRMLRLQAGLAADEPLRFPGVQDADRLLYLFAAALPPVAATVAAIVQTGNLWLAARIVKLSGRLKRTWPDLSAMSFPPYAALLVVIAIAATFLPDLAGLIASLFAATLTLAFAVLGFAVVHAMTRGINGRPAILAGAYGVVAIMGWPVLIVALIGLAETLFHLRARAGTRGPPTSPKS
jgi:Predicted membrane protein (DUF2232)